MNNMAAIRTVSNMANLKATSNEASEAIPIVVELAMIGVNALAEQERHNIEAIKISEAIDTAYSIISASATQLRSSRMSVGDNGD